MTHRNRVSNRRHWLNRCHPALRFEKVRRHFFGQSSVMKIAQISFPPSVQDHNNRTFFVRQIRCVLASPEISFYGLTHPSVFHG